MARAKMILINIIICISGDTIVIKGEYSGSQVLHLALSINIKLFYYYLLLLIEIEQSLLHSPNCTSVVFFHIIQIWSWTTF